MEPKFNRKQFVIWITGLPGSGKTTLASGLKSLLVEEGLNVIHLDGDALRVALNAENSLDLKSRKSLANSYQRIGKLINDQGFTVIVSTVSLFSEVFTTNREMFQNYFEIFLSVEQRFLESGPREMQYMESENVYTKTIHPEYPIVPHLTLHASNPKDRDSWLEIAFAKLSIELDLNVK
jgi:adenylylsulfate kinase-like enzyme